MNALNDPEPLRVIVGPDELGERLDKILARALPSLTRSRIKSLIEAGQVSGYTPGSGITPTPILSASKGIKTETTLLVTIPEPETADPEPEHIPLDIIFEDDHLIVINKPPTLVMHPAPGSPTGTLVNALLFHCGDSLSGIGGVKRPGIVHRIDKETSGLVVVAKHDRAHTGLAAQFADHSISRKYMAVVRGHPKPPKGRIEGNIGRHPVDRKKMAVVEQGGKWAATHYRTEIFYQSAGLPLAARIECELETGRTHQVRVHMTHRGYPLVGDPVYGRSGRLPNGLSATARAALQGFDRQALHAKHLGFHHPVNGKVLSFDAEPPHDMKCLLERLAPFAVGGAP